MLHFFVCYLCGIGNNSFIKSHTAFLRMNASECKGIIVRNGMLFIYQHQSPVILCAIYAGGCSFIWDAISVNVFAYSGQAEDELYGDDGKEQREKEEYAGLEVSEIYGEVKV